MKLILVLGDKHEGDHRLIDNAVEHEMGDMQYCGVPPIGQVIIYKKTQYCVKWQVWNYDTRQIRVVCVRKS